MTEPDSTALDALAVALAPRLLRELRALIEAESDEARDYAEGVAELEAMGYRVGPPRVPGPSVSPPARPKKRRRS